MTRATRDVLLLGSVGSTRLDYGVSVPLDVIVNPWAYWLCSTSQVEAINRSWQRQVLELGPSELFLYVYSCAIFAIE